MRDQGLEDTITLNKLIDTHNEQVHLIHHYKEKYEQRQQFCIDLLNKSSEAVAVLRKLHQRVKTEEGDSAKAPAAEDGSAAVDAAGSSRKSNEGQRPTDDQLQV